MCYLMMAQIFLKTKRMNIHNSGHYLEGVPRSVQNYLKPGKQAALMEAEAEEGNLAEFAAGEDECLEEDEADNEEGGEEQNDEEEGGEEDSDDGEEQEEEEEDEAEPQQRSSRHRGKQPRMEATHNRDGSKRARRN